MIGKSAQQSDQAIEHMAGLGKLVEQTSMNLQVITELLRGPERASKNVGEVIGTVNVLINNGVQVAQQLLASATNLQEGAHASKQAVQSFKI